MSKQCHICAKKPIFGNSIRRRGKPKREGGVGQKITGRTPRKFHPNLQSKRIVEDGKAIKVFVCAKCLKKGNLKIATR
jgi:large subunit ribosomal protein L28